jgi:hypothetical protein
MGPLRAGYASGIVMPNGERYLITGSFDAPVLEYVGGGNRGFGAFVAENWRPNIKPDEVRALVEQYIESKNQ